MTSLLWADTARIKLSCLIAATAVMRRGSKRSCPKSGIREPVPTRCVNMAAANPDPSRGDKTWWTLTVPVHAHSS